MNLLDRTVDFTAALRRAGVPVSSAETVDAAAAIGALGWADRDAVREAFAATMCKRPLYRPAFDTLFDLYFPPRIGDGVNDPRAGDGGDAADGAPTDSEAPARDLTPEELDALRQALRADLLDALRDGDDETLRALARQAVGSFGAGLGSAGRSWFLYRVLRAMSAETLVADLLSALLGDAERGGLAERVARQTIADRIRAFEDMVAGEVRRRMAEERGIDAVERTAVKPLADQVEFLRASQRDLVDLRRQVYPLARRLATRLTARRRLGRAGRLDFRRTVRASLATGGVPVETKHRPHKPHKPELVVLCDVSGSVSSFAHFTLMLTHALREQFAKVRAFAFIDTTDEVSRFLRGLDLGDMMARISSEADLVWLDGHSDYGHAIEVFAERYPDAVGPRTSLLVLGDARNNYRPTSAPVFRQLCAQARHSYWLNPEPRGYWGSGDSATDVYANLVDEMVECRNVEQLQDFIERILPS
ncbi:Protein containing von Willebrand factor type A (VWA) domain [Frankia canadensis]|uniref:Protein containing von Willebrand factor type A (VWA) domain n=1 Tax=Frankia canadensis TaxID=1836972 RepID=A0A2I2L0U8_9ACTN|nr:VWA domain-containing protein [Frankia canadensis]SNQ51546.1 Protein containing von Willebrand factor type A (VWA) domain [Frankia canadensis]SOU58836.1 Protein containing von Willebrand factor type A (VWA) domain [Frankia canadensis]